MVTVSIKTRKITLAYHNLAILKIYKMISVCVISHDQYIYIYIYIYHK